LLHFARYVGWRQCQDKRQRIISPRAIFQTKIPSGVTFGDNSKKLPMLSTRNLYHARGMRGLGGKRLTHRIMRPDPSATVGGPGLVISTTRAVGC
jgi:hypothetical protein